MKIKTLREYVENPPKVIPQKGWTLKQYMEGDNPGGLGQPADIYDAQAAQARATPQQPQQAAAQQPAAPTENDPVKQIDAILGNLIGEYQKKLTDLCNKYIPAMPQNWLFGKNTTLGNYGWGGVFKRLVGGQNALRNTYGQGWDSPVSGSGINASTEYRGMSLTEYVQFQEEIEKEIDFITRVVFKTDLLFEQLGENPTIYPDPTMRGGEQSPLRADTPAATQPAQAQQGQQQQGQQQKAQQAQQQKAHAALLADLNALLQEFKQKAMLAISGVLKAQKPEAPEAPETGAVT